MAATILCAAIDINTQPELLDTLVSQKRVLIKRKDRFFKTILHHYGLHAHEILHVGDSPAEMEAARRMGLRTCWINRNNNVWPNDRMPDDMVLSLDQLDGILPLHT